MDPRNAGTDYGVCVKMLSLQQVPAGRFYPIPGNRDEPYQNVNSVLAFTYRPNKRTTFFSCSAEYGNLSNAERTFR